MRSWAFAAVENSVFRAPSTRNVNVASLMALPRVLHDMCTVTHEATPDRGFSGADISWLAPLLPNTCNDQVPCNVIVVGAYTADSRKPTITSAVADVVSTLQRNQRFPEALSPAVSILRLSLQSLFEERREGHGA